jgi:hypothetical protein
MGAMPFKLLKYDMLQMRAIIPKLSAHLNSTWTFNMHCCVLDDIQSRLDKSWLIHARW